MNNTPTSRNEEVPSSGAPTCHREIRQVENNQFTMVFFRCLNSGRAIVGFIAEVRGSGFQKGSDGTAHGASETR